MREDRDPGSRPAMWMALRRAHQGGVSTLGDHWLDSGRPVPCYIAKALDELVHGGLLVAGEVDHEACGVRRFTVTDDGCARYVALCRIHRPAAKAAVIVPHRWVCSPRDQRSHLLTRRWDDDFGIWVGVCGHHVLWSVPVSVHPTGPRCPTCEALPTRPVPAPQFNIPPIAGRPPAEPTPGGRPVTTTRCPRR